MIGIKADHNDMCSLKSDSEQLVSITSFIDSATHDTRKVIEKVSVECK